MSVIRDEQKILVVVKKKVYTVQAILTRVLFQLILSVD